MSKNNDTLVEAQDLTVYFPVHVGSILKRKIGDIKAVDGINFRITQGETMGLVGESGSGKTTTGQAILQIDQPTGGKIFFEGEEVTGSRQGERSFLRVRRSPG
jgi:ABC-type oligopeptide transport system ATPase subunit